MSQEKNAAEIILPDELAAAVPGDVVGIRTDWDAIVTGVVKKINDSERLQPGEWVVILDDPIMWDVAEGEGERIQLDKGPPLDQPSRVDGWNGPCVALAVGTNKCGFPLAGVPIVRQPHPVYGPDGVSHYTGLPAGAIEDVAADGPVEPSDLLKEGDEPPKVTATDAEARGADTVGGVQQ